MYYIFSFLYFIHFCILLNIINKQVLYCITANTLERSRGLYFSLRIFFYIKCLDPSLFPQCVHFFRLTRLYCLYEREGCVLLKIELRRRHILVAHHLHGKTSGFTVEANNSKIQVMKGGNFHRKLSVYHLQKSVSFTKNSERILNRNLESKMALKNMNLNMNFRSEHFKPGKRDYLFRCSFSVGTTIKVVIQY